VEFNPTFCRLLRARYPEATLVQGDAYSMRRLLEALLLQPAAAVVSGLPLVTKPLKMRLRLIRGAFDLMLPGAPFVQFTYSVASPLPRRLGGFSVAASESPRHPTSMRPKILIIAASLRAGSHNARLAALAAKELTLAEADVTRISLADYALPIFDADLMADSGLPPP